MSAYGGGSDFNNPSDVVNHFPAGRMVYSIRKDNLSIPVGEEVNIPIVLHMEEFSYYYIYQIIDQDVSVTIDWFNSVNMGYVRESTLLVPASSPDGGYIKGRVQGSRLNVRFTNNSLGPDLTQLYVVVFGVQ